MSEFLKGNFETKNAVNTNENTTKDSLESRFEEAALKKLGGSIAFVSKKKVMWDLETPDK